MEQVRFGIVGIGNMGTAHVRRFVDGKVPGAVLTAVCDINPARLEWVKSYCAEKGVKQPNAYDDCIKMLDSGDIDAILIAVPHYHHPIYGIEAFKRKINVLCEKPIGVYTKNVQEFIKAAKESGCAFGLMFNQRTDKYYQKMREMVVNGELGELKRCIWIITDWYRTQAYYDSGGWRATWAGEGGGVLLNQCPHNLDLWQWIFGMPSRIRAFCHFGKYHDIEVEDDVTAYAEYPNGATGVFITTTGEYPGTNRLEISGSRGKLVREGRTLKFYRLSVDEREYNATTKEGFGRIPFEVIDVQVEGFGGAHTEICRNFTDHILKGTPLIAPGEEGIRGLSISNAMMLSTWKDDWIELPIDGDEFYAYLMERVKTSRHKEVSPTAEVADLSGTYNN